MVSNHVIYLRAAYVDMSRVRLQTRMIENSLIGDTVIEYKHPTRDMKYIVNHNAFETRVFFYNETSSNWEIDRPILDSNETQQFKIKTFIIFEYRQDKHNLTVKEFDAMTTDLIEELEAHNTIIFSRSLGCKMNTIELGVIAPYKTITPELIGFYSKGFRDLGVDRILLMRDGNEPAVVWDEFVWALAHKSEVSL
jgi:hypothetical protein